VPKKERKGSPEARLRALFEAGDWRAARAEAERLRASGGAGAEVAADAEQRMSPDGSAVWAAAVGAGFLAAVAAVGLFLR